MWFWKRRITNQPQHSRTTLEDSWNDFLSGKGLRTVEVHIVLTEPPKIRYELWSHRQLGSSKRHTAGSYVVTMWGTIKRAYEAATLQGRTCSIEINNYGGASGEEQWAQGFLGNARIEDRLLGMTIDTKASCVSDLVTLMNIHKLENINLLRIRTDLVYPRSIPVDEVRSFQITHFFARYDEENREIEPWTPPK